MIYGARVCLRLTDGLVADGCYAMLHRGEMFCEEGARLCAFVSENERGVFYVADKKEYKINNRKTIHLWS